MSREARQQVVAQIKAGLPGFCVCDIAYTDRQMEDPNCPTHDIGRWLSEGFDVRHYPNDNCGNPAHDRILEAWYARADVLLERAGISTDNKEPSDD